MISKKRRAKAIDALEVIEFFQRARELYEMSQARGRIVIPLKSIWEEDDRSLSERATAILSASAAGSIKISDEYRAKLLDLAPSDVAGC